MAIPAGSSKENIRHPIIPRKKIRQLVSLYCLFFISTIGKKNVNKIKQGERLINDFERILTMPLPQPAMASCSQANNQVIDLIAYFVNN